MEYDEYRQKIEYYPIEYPDNSYIYHFEYIQKTFKNKKLHYHHGLEIGICLEGDGIFIIGNNVYKFTKNCVTFIPPDLPHIAQSANESPSRWKFLTIDWEKIFGNNTLEIKNNIIHSEDMAKLALMIYDEVDKKQDFYQNISHHLLNALICQMLRYENGHEEISSTATYNGAVYAAICYICNNYSENFTITELAATNNYSVNYFRKIFREQTGMTPHDYLINIRLKMASIMLRSTDKSILEISCSSGFTTLSSFNRFFKEKYGMTPTQWRKNKNVPCDND